MSHSLAWVTPFGPASDISAFSHNLLHEFHRVAETLDATITVFVNAHGASYWTPLPTIALTGTETDVDMLLGYDFVVFNIGNNTANHGHINRLALQVPGVLIVHDLVMHGALAAMLGFGTTKAETGRRLHTADRRPLWHPRVGSGCAVAAMHVCGECLVHAVGKLRGDADAADRALRRKLRGAGRTFCPCGGHRAPAGGDEAAPAGFALGSEAQPL
jgi:hypothetical protein